MEPLSANDPQAVGEYLVRARLGAGGMGRVYLAYSRAGRAVAVKVIHPQLAQDPGFRERFSREVAAARAVSGMYTAPVVAAGLGDDPPWLATAYVPGPSLSALVNRHGALPAAATWRLAAGLAEALGAVHACGIVHRDLKPANVLLAADGPHVIDFGISRALDGTSVTATGMAVGTPGYMSPEQAEGAKSGPASDVFSLGCVLAYAATGNAPFGAGSAASVLYRVVNAQPDLTGVCDRLRGVIMACLAKDPAQRPGLGALSVMIAQAGPAITATPTSFWPDPVAALIRAAEATPAQVSGGESGATGGPGGALRPATAPAGMAQAGRAGHRGPRRHPRAWRMASRAGPPRPATAPAGMAQGEPGGPPRPATSPVSMAPAPGQAPRQGGWPQDGLTRGAAGQAPPVHASPLQDGYLAAATASMAAGPGSPTWGMTKPLRPGGSSWPHASPGSWPEPSGTDPLAQYRPAPPRPRPPTSVVAAAWLMYSGAAVSLLHILVILATIGKVTTGFKKSHPFFPASTANSLAAIDGIEVLVIGTVVITLWLWLASASKQGHGWVRTLGSVLFGIDTFAGLVLLRVPGITGVTALGVVLWLIGLAAVIMLWQRTAGDFFASRR